MKILFVCTANICRSAYAELTARRLAAELGVEDLDFASAGTHGLVDQPIDPTMAEVLPAGVAHSGFRSRPVTRELLEEADLIITAEGAHRIFILTEHPRLIRKVLTLGQAAAVAERLAAEGLDRRSLLARMGTDRGAADPATDVPDPYRRGPRAAADAAERIAGPLRVILRALATD